MVHLKTKISEIQERSNYYNAKSIKRVFKYFILNGLTEAARLDKNITRTISVSLKVHPGQLALSNTLRVL